MKVSAVNSVGMQTFALQPRDNVQFSSNPVVATYQPAAAPDYAVKTPTPYAKLYETELPYGLKAHNYKLANGQRVVIVPKEGETVVRTYVNSGSMNELDRVRGISHYLEHNLFNGSDGLEEGNFFKIVDKMGASTNASTDFARTDYFVSSNLLNKDDLENKIKIHASMLETPLFMQSKLDKEKEIVCSEINMIMSDPQTIASNTTVKNLYGIKSASPELIGGTADNIRNITREDILDYHNRNYHPANMTTVITGEVTPEEAMRLVSKNFTSKKPPVPQHYEDLKPLEQSVREDIISDKATAATIMLGFNGPANSSGKEKVYLEALQVLLGAPSVGRFSEKLKPYGTSAYVNDYRVSNRPNDGVAVMVNAETTGGKSEDVLRAVWDQIHGVQTNPPDADEMRIIKKDLMKNYAQIFEHSFRINDAIGAAMLDSDLDYLSNYEKIVNAMTADDLVRAAQKYLDLNKVAITVVHPKAQASSQVSQRVHFCGRHAVKPENVNEYVLPNNIRLVTNDISTPNACMKAAFKCETPVKANPAAYAILGNILNEGTADKTRKEFAKELLQEGIELAFVSGDKGITAYSSFNANDTKAALRALKEVLYSPRFADDALLQAKKDIRESILMSEKSAARNLNYELFKGQYRGITDEEVLANLDKVTMQDVMALWGGLLAGAQAKVAISAPPETLDAVCDELGSMHTVKESKYTLQDTFREVGKTKVVTDVDTKNQAKIIQAYTFRTNRNLKDEATLKLLNSILGGGPSSRLFNDLRERQQLAYGVSSSVSHEGNTGLVELSIGTTTENADTGEVSYDNLQKSINGFHKHIRKLQTEKVSAEELRSAGLSLKNDILSGSETAAGKTRYIGKDTPYGALHKNQLLEMIDTITAEDIQNAANYIFAGKPTYSIVATENTLKYNQEFLQKLT